MKLKLRRNINLSGGQWYFANKATGGRVSPCFFSKQQAEAWSLARRSQAAKPLQHLAPPPNPL